MSLSTFKNPSTLVQNQQQQQDQIKALIIGISGCSSSGKTTLARLLRDLFNQNSSGSSTINRTFILHQDDFYRPEADLPIHKGFRDWDCPEAIDISAMANSLQYIRSHGSLPVSNMSGKNPLSARDDSRTNHGIVENQVRYLPGEVDESSKRGTFDELIAEDEFSCGLCPSLKLCISSLPHKWYPRANIPNSSTADS